MAQLDHQLTAVDEVTYATAVTTSRAWEFNSESIAETEGRTEGEPLRTGYTRRNDRFTPYFAGAAGTVEFDVLTKGFGFWLKHMMGAVATTGPAETTVYTHTGTFGELVGDSFTMQVNRPFHPAGTNQAFTYSGGKITNWNLSNSVDGNLVLSLDMDFAAVADDIALATASYPTGMEPFSWAGGTVTIGAVQADVTEFSVSCNNNLNVDRRFIRANTEKKEPTGGKREVEFSLACDFDALTHRDRAHATTRAGALAAIVATWNGPTLLGTTLYPQVSVTIPAARFDSWEGAVAGDEGISQALSGVGTWDGTNSPVTVVVKSADSAA